jgi:hypothetical protein
LASRCPKTIVHCWCNKHLFFNSLCLLIAMLPWIILWTIIHSSDILSIRFKHTRIIRFFGLFKKYLKILDHRCLWVWAQLKLSLLSVLLIVFTYFTYSHFQNLKYLKILLFEHLRKIRVFRMSLLCYNPCTKIWANLVNNQLLFHQLFEWLKPIELSMAMIMGSVEDERCFSNLGFMKCELRNKLTTHLDLVVKMFVHKFFIMNTFPFCCNNEFLDYCKIPPWCIGIVQVTKNL